MVIDFWGKGFVYMGRRMDLCWDLHGWVLRCVWLLIYLTFRIWIWYFSGLGF